MLVELEWNGILRSKTTMSHFELNGRLDPELFDATPPADYTVRAFDLETSDPSEAGLIASLRAVAGWNDGKFIDDLNAASASALIAKKAAADKDDHSASLTRRAMEFTAIGVGLEFALALPESAEAHYAGKGVRLDEPNRPIFWYKPVGSETYRLIYADLSVKDADRPPQAALRLLAAEQASSFQAFNVLAEALLDAKSATFEMRVNVQGKVDQTFQSSYLVPGKMRNEIKGLINFVSITDLPAGKCVMLIAAQKLALVVNMKNRAARGGRPDADDVFEQVRSLLEQSREAKDEKFDRLGEKEIDAHHAVGFRHGTSIDELTLWGDPVTGLPVRVELVWSGDPHTEVTMSHFELNEKLDPKLFDTTPPAGYQIQKIDFDLSQPGEQTLVETLRLLADWNDGRFADNLGMASSLAALSKKVSAQRKEKPDSFPTEAIGQMFVIARGLEFVSDLPAASDAHYAGKGVKVDEADRPIFWYKPQDAKAYRVIYADLSVKDAEQAPQVAGAVWLGKALPAEADAPADKPAE